MSKRSVLLAALILVLLPLVAGIVHVLISPPTGVPGGDFALLELATREALEGTRLLGPYSRFEWNHPGPAMFYLLAAPYRIFGGSTGLYIGTLVLNAGMAAGLVAVHARQGGSRAAIASAAVLLALMLALGPDRLRDPWNPYLVIFPTLLATALSVAAWGGSVRALLGAALVGSIAAQAHIATAPFVLAILAVSAVVLWRRRSPQTRVAGVAEVGMVGALVVLWLPPVIEQITAVDGNIGHILRFAAEGHGGHTLAAGVSAVGTAASSISFDAAPPMIPSVPTWSAAATLIVLAAAGAWLARHASGWTRALALGGLLATGTAAVLATRIVGDLLTYLVVWMVGGPVLIWTAAATFVVRRHEVLAAAAAAVLSVAAAGLAFSADNESRHPPSTIAASHVLDAAAQRGADSVALVIADQERWSTAAGVALALDRAGLDVRVDQTYVPMFGQQRLASGDEALQVVMTGVRGSTAPGLTPLGWAPDTRLYLAGAQRSGQGSTAAAP